MRQSLWDWQSLTSWSSISQLETLPHPTHVVPMGKPRIKFTNLYIMHQLLRDLTEFSGCQLVFFLAYLFAETA